MEDHRKRQTIWTRLVHRFSFRDFIVLLLGAIHNLYNVGTCVTVHKKTNANVALSFIRIFNSLFITDATTAPF